MSDRNEIVSQFTDVTGSNEERAKFYLEASEWRLEVALASFYEEDDSDMKIDSESIENEASVAEVQPDVRSVSAASSSKPTFQSSKSTSKAKPHSTGGSKIRTLASLNQGNGGSSDEGEGQAFYAGGSDSSGQQILGPGKKKKDIVADMFKSVQEHGAEAVDPGDADHESRPSSSFHGTGYRLGQSSDDSQVVSGATQRKAQPVNVVLKLWREGFSVDDGPLRKYSDPENKEFLESIRRGEVPSELVQEIRNEIQLQMEDHRHEDPHVAKSKVKAFSGKGNVLGTPTPGAAGSDPSSAPAMDEKAKQASEEAARKALEIDPAKPQTSIQIRLADGSVLIARLNHSHTIADLRRFITIARPQYENSTFSLLMTFPRKELADDTETVEKAGILNAAVLQRLLGIGTRSHPLNVAGVACSVVKQDNKKGPTIQEIDVDDTQDVKKKEIGVFKEVDAQLMTNPYSTQSALLKENSQLGHLYDHGLRSCNVQSKSKDNITINANENAIVPVENITIYTTSYSQSSIGISPDYSPSDFDMTDSPSEVSVLSEHQQILRGLPVDLAAKSSDKLSVWSENRISRNDFKKIKNSEFSSNTEASSTICLSESSASKNLQGVCVPCWKVGNLKAESERNVEVMFPKDQNNATSEKSANVGSIRTENINDERKFKNVGITCCIPATVFGNKRTSQLNNALLATCTVGNSSISVETEYNEKDYELLNTNDISRRKSSHLMPFKKVIIGCSDKLNRWTSLDGDPYTFVERYIPSENFETLCSFCSDVDGTFYENNSDYLNDGDRFFRCRRASTCRASKVPVVEPFLTSPSAEACDLPVSFVAAVRSTQQQQPSQKGLIRDQDKTPRVSSPVAVRETKGDASLSRNGAKVCRLQPQIKQGPTDTPRGSVCIANRTHAFDFVSKRQEKSPPEFSGRFKPSMTKRSMTAHDNRGRKERDDVLQSPIPRLKRQLRTSPEKL